MRGSVARGSVTEQTAEELRRVLPHHEAHPHQALAGDPARGHGKREFLRPGRLLLLHPPPEHGPDEEEQAVVPVKRPRQPDARGRRDEVLVLGDGLGEHGQDNAHEAADDHAPDLDRSEPRTLASGTSRRKASTLTSVPTKMPANWAMNCFRGCAPSR